MVYNISEFNAMSSLNNYGDITTADRLDELRKELAQNKAGNTSQQKITPQYVIPELNTITITTSMTGGIPTNYRSNANTLTLTNAMYNGQFGTAYAAVETEATDTTLMLCYKFDGDVNDASANGYNGTLSGSGSYVTGKLGNALQFNGTDTVVRKTTTANISASTVRTACAWVYATDNSNDGTFGHRIFQKWDDSSNDYCMAQNTSGYISGQFKLSGTVYSARTASSSFAINTMYHLAITHNAGTTAIYINGAVSSGGTSTTSSSSSTTDLQVGRRSATEGRFAGWIDDLRLYNYALSANEINAIYNNGLVGLGSRVPNAARANFSEAN